MRSYRNQKYKNWMLLLVFLLVGTLAVPAFALESSGMPQSGQKNGANTGVKQSDLDNHWAEDAMRQMEKQGVVKGYPTGGYKPDKAIERAEFVQMATTLFNYNKEGAVTFKDVKKEDWFFSCISRAVGQGFISGYDGRVQPKMPVIREQAAVMMGKMLKVSPDSDVSKFPDAGKISDYARGYVGALAKEGYLSGDENGKFDPQTPMTRGEAAALLARASGTQYREAGVYDLKNANVTGNVTIVASGITLKNGVVEGDLYITEGVGTGEVTLENMKVKGRTIISGGGMNSIVFINTNLGRVSVEVPDGTPIRIVASGNTSIGVVEAGSEGKLQEEGLTGSGFGEVIISVPDGARVSLDGDFDGVTLDSKNAKLDVLDGNIHKLTVTEQGGGSDIKISSDAKVKNLDCNASVDVGGTGRIDTAVVNSTGVTISQIPGSVKVGKGITANVGNKEVTEHSKPGSNGSSGGSHSSSNTNLAYTTIDISYGTGVTVIKLCFSEPIKAMRGTTDLGSVLNVDFCYAKDNIGTGKQSISNAYVSDQILELTVNGELTKGTHYIGTAGTESISIVGVNSGRTYQISELSLGFETEKNKAELLTITGIEQPSVLEAGTKLALAATIGGERKGIVTYQWYKGETPILGATNTTLSYDVGRNDDQVKLCLHVMETKGNVRMESQSTAIVLNVQWDSSPRVYLKDDSQGQGGDQRVNGLEVGKRYYIYSDEDGKTYPVLADGSLGDPEKRVEYKDLQDLTVDYIKGLTNGQWYRVTKVTAAMPKLTSMQIQGGMNGINMGGYVSPRTGVDIAKAQSILTITATAASGDVIRLSKNGAVIQAANGKYKVSLDTGMLKEEMLIELLPGGSEQDKSAYYINTKRNASTEVVQTNGAYNYSLIYGDHHDLGYVIKYPVSAEAFTGITCGGVTLRGSEDTSVTDGAIANVDYVYQANAKGQIEITVLKSFVANNLAEAGTYALGFQFNDGVKTIPQNVYRQAKPVKPATVVDGNSGSQYTLEYHENIDLSYVIRNLDSPNDFAGIACDGYTLVGTTDSAITDGAIALVEYTYTTNSRGEIEIKVLKNFVKSKLAVVGSHFLDFQFEKDSAAIQKQVVRQAKQPVAVVPSTYEYGDPYRLKYNQNIDLSYLIRNLDSPDTFTGITFDKDALVGTTDSAITDGAIAQVDYTYTTNSQGQIEIKVLKNFVATKLKNQGSHTLAFMIREGTAEEKSVDTTVVREAAPAAIDSTIDMGIPEFLKDQEDYISIFVPLTLTPKNGTAEPVSYSAIQNRVKADNSSLEIYDGDGRVTSVRFSGGYMPIENYEKDRKAGMKLRFPTLLSFESSVGAVDFDRFKISLWVSNPPDEVSWETVLSQELLIPKSDFATSSAEMNLTGATIGGRSSIKLKDLLQGDRILTVTGSPDLSISDGSYEQLMQKKVLLNPVTMADGVTEGAVEMYRGDSSNITLNIAEKNKRKQTYQFNLAGPRVTTGDYIVTHEVSLPSGGGSNEYRLDLVFNDGTSNVALDKGALEAKKLDLTNTVYSLGTKDGEAIRISLAELLDTKNSGRVSISGNTITFGGVRELLAVFKINPTKDQIGSRIAYTPKLTANNGKTTYHPIGGSTNNFSGGSGGSPTFIVTNMNGEGPQTSSLILGQTTEITVPYPEAAFKTMLPSGYDLVMYDEDGNDIASNQKIILDPNKPRVIAMVLAKDGLNGEILVYKIRLTYDPNGVLPKVLLLPMQRSLNGSKLVTLFETTIDMTAGEQLKELSPIMPEPAEKVEIPSQDAGDSSKPSIDSDGGFEVHPGQENEENEGSNFEEYPSGEIEKNPGKNFEVYPN